MHSSTTSAMQREMDNLRSERDKTLIALRDLEMGNDELERNERFVAGALLHSITNTFSIEWLFLHY